MPDFLLEIGAEEIPAGYIAPALEAMAANIGRQLDAQRIEHGTIKTYGTPLRLAVAVADVAPRQRPLKDELQGPPSKVAFDGQGRPTTAAVKFAEKAGVPLNRLKVKETEKGAYVFASRREKGRATRGILKAILPRVVAAVPFPKSMRWGDLSVEFARPIHTLLALFGEQLVGFEFAGIKSGRYILGHRFMRRGKIKIGAPDEYLPSLREAHVYADIAERRQMVKDAISESAATVNASVLPDDELVDIVTNLVEFPVVSLGSFDQKFLDLPDEVLITSMREHQKYFALADQNDRLMSYFIAVNNTPVKDIAVVTTGHERVLRARLEDAKFFFHQDMQIPLDQSAAKLADVLFQAQLGSIGEKVERIVGVSEYIAPQLDTSPDFVSTVSRAAALSKADLVTLMVGEFPKLQGVMGRLYAERQGEDPSVAAVLEEHWRPVYSGAALPATAAGAIVSIADKIDSICGCFCVGLIPSGTADPYALRRLGIGLIQIIIARDLKLSLPELISKNLELLQAKATQDLDATARKVLDFLQNRITHLLVDEGYSKDTIAAVLGAGVEALPDIWQKVSALEAQKARPDFEPLAVAFKRVVNIIKKAGDFSPEPVQPKRFEHDAEQQLLDAFESVQQSVSANMEQRDFANALSNIVALKGPVDAFFDDVMVMVDDPEIRQNRLSLLGKIAGLFNRFADFSKLAV